MKSRARLRSLLTTPSRNLQRPYGPDQCTIKIRRPQRGLHESDLPHVRVAAVPSRCLPERRSRSPGSGTGSPAPAAARWCPATPGSPPTAEAASRGAAPLRGSSPDLFPRQCVVPLHWNFAHLTEAAVYCRPFQVVRSVVNRVLGRASCIAGSPWSPRTAAAASRC